MARRTFLALAWLAAVGWIVLGFTLLPLSWFARGTTGWFLVCGALLVVAPSRLLPWLAIGWGRRIRGIFLVLAGAGLGLVQHLAYAPGAHRHHVLGGVAAAMLAGGLLGHASVLHLARARHTR